ncbi:uncharacterized protein LOC121263203 [Juglans microcarpa x Juglans regia]|uniref:uncharacterized protein LOC121263203 n=1 Tax=Juglans microcarpa x Juglans regia TaxID=2249226 RepID=UPI001B7EE5C3|nr:uncharacterized protein LOC121263203 [Juglans microcarpa x Juglans regia]
MEANKERREQLEIKKREEITRDQGEKKKKNNNNFPENTTTQSSTGFDPMAKILIRETIVADSGGDQGDHGAEAPDDVLAFSRSVHKIDSSLE